MAGHAENSRRTPNAPHWHEPKPPWSSYPPHTKTVAIGSLEHKRALSDPVPHRGLPRHHLTYVDLRHSDRPPLVTPASASGAATAFGNDGGSITHRTCEPLVSMSLTGNTRGDSDGARTAIIGQPSLVHRASTAPSSNAGNLSAEPGSPAHAQTLTLSPSAGSMKIALKPRLSHQHTPIPTQHLTASLSHKAPAGHYKSPHFPRLTIDIPESISHYGSPAFDMATSPQSPSANTKTSLPGQKRVTFSQEQPEIIPQPSKRRQSSVNQRPSWSNVFLLRDSKPRDDVAARSRSLSPGPSILKEVSAFKSDVSDAELKKDEHGKESKVHISPLWKKDLKRPPRGRKKAHALPIPQAKVSRNASPRAFSPEDASPRDVSPTSLSARHASPRDGTFDKSASDIQTIIVHPPSPPESEDEEDEDAIEDSDESPQTSRNNSVEEVEGINSRFTKVDIDGSSHAHRHEKRKDSSDSRKDSKDSRKDSQDWRESRKSSYGSRKGSDQSDKDSDRPPPPPRRSSSADQAEMWLRRSSIYGVRSKAPRLPTRLGSLRV